MSVSVNIKLLRQQKNLTQKELGDILHVSNKTISKWENGRGLPDIETIKRIAEVLNVKVLDIVDDFNTETDREAIKNDKKKNKLYSFIRANKSYIALFFIYNFYWYIWPIQKVITFMKEGSLKSIFTAITAVPGMVFILYQYVFKYYLVIPFIVYLVYRLFTSKNKRLQHIVCLVLLILYLFLYKYIGFLFNEFPFPFE